MSKRCAFCPKFGIAIWLGFSGIGSALAQQSQIEPRDNLTSDMKTEKLDEVVVTAQKRSERLIEVPISIVAIGSDELQKRHINSLEDLASAVPDLSLVRTGTSTAFEIRGVANIAGGKGPLIGLYFDDADVTLPLAVQINPTTYDLERVEVLRGPQGTLYGEGSPGGTVRLISNNPNLNHLSLDSQLTTSFTDGGDPSQRVNAMVNVPVIDNQLGLRIAATYEHDGGWIDLPLANESNYNSRNLKNVRVKGLWQPDSQWTVGLTMIVNRDSRGVDFSDVNSPGTFTQTFNSPTSPTMRSDYELYSLTTAYEFPSVARIQNVVSYLGTSSPQYNNPQIFPLVQPGSGPPLQFLVPYSNTTDHLATDELRLVSTDTGPWEWTAGAFFRQAGEHLSIPMAYADFVEFPTPPGAGLPSPIAPYFDYYSQYKSWSVFADSSYQVSDRFKLGAGVRYAHEDQTFPTEGRNAEFHSTDPRVYAQFKLAPDINLYASAAKGFRDGGINAVGNPDFNPESVRTYELGTKMTILEGRLDIDTALFWSNYTNYVVFGTDPATLLTFSTNEGKARIKGIESSIIWRVLPQWRLEARGNYLDARFTEITAIQSAYNVGDPIDFVPRFQFTVSGQRDFNLFDKSGFVRLDYSETGPQTYRNRYLSGPGAPSTPWFYESTQDIKLLGANVSIKLNDSLRVGLFGQNLLNDQHYNVPFGLLQQGVRSRPRTIGIELGAGFN